MNDWRARAACVGMPANFWFPDQGNNAAAAKNICATCPVRQDCYDTAVAEGETYGIWGGVSFARADTRPKIVRSRKINPPGLHGTRAGYQRHRQRGEEACKDCRMAEASYHRLRRAQGMAS